MATTSTSITEFDYDPLGAMGTSMVLGGAGNDKLFGGSGNDLMDGGGGSDDLKAGSGDDVMVYHLAQNVQTAAQDLYTGGSGIDCVRLLLSQSEWSDPAVRGQLERYVTHLAQVQRNPKGEVANGIASDFTFQFANGATLTVQMTERLEVGVWNGSTYTVVDHLKALITGTLSGNVLEAGGVANGAAGVPTIQGTLAADDLNGPDNAFQTLSGVSTYGTYSLTSAGVWTYNLDNTHAKVQQLQDGSKLTDTFKVMAVDGGFQHVTVTITGQNDAAVLTGDVAGEVTEAGGVANGTAGKASASGNLDATDVDNTADLFQEVKDGAGKYGTFGVTTAGGWTYQLDDTNTEVQQLNAGGKLTDTFTVLTADGTAQQVTVTINGANDAAVISGDTTGEVTEAGGVANGTAGDATASGNLDATDVDNTADLFQEVKDGAGKYGTFGVTTAGGWTYQLDDTNTDVQKLNVAGKLTDTFTVLTVDGTAQQVTVTINGANDAAVISGDTSGEVTEAGGVANGTAGDATASGNLDATDVDNTADLFQEVKDGAGKYGTFGVTTAGGWTYQLDDANTDVQKLNVAGKLTDTFTVLTVDGTAQQVTVTINGANDSAVISGDTAGEVTEAGGVANGTAGDATASGNLDATDVDNTADLFQEVKDGAGKYGTFGVTTAGGWTYQLDDANTDVQKLNVAGKLTDTFTVLTVDGTAQQVTVTINGANDAAVISGDTSGEVTEAGGVANGTAGDATASGNLDATDVDNTADLFQEVKDGAGKYGTFGVTTAGGWTYQLDDANTDVQQLNAGGKLTDTFTVLTADGTAQQVTVTINGANDAAVISGDTAGEVTEAGGVANGTAGDATASGNLDATDVDNTADLFQEVKDGAGKYGTFGVTTAGGWTYQLDDANTDVQKLNAGGKLTDTFTVLTVDGTAQQVTVTINGANDAAVISGDTAGEVTEAGGVANGTAGDATASGNLDATDVDNTADLFQEVKDGAGKYGTFGVTTAGGWTYQLDDANTDVQKLNAGGKLTDTFTVLTVDGTAQQVTVTINGANDAAVISGDTAGEVTEAGGVANGTAGDATASGNLDATDVDNVADLFQEIKDGAGKYGTFGVTTAGGWTYQLDDTNTDVQQLNAGGKLTDTFTVLTADGTAQQVTVTINGANDSAVISGDTAGEVTEAGGVANGTAGDASASGNLDATDVDNVADLFQEIKDGAGKYGTFGVTTAGGWTYQLDDTNTDVQKLNVAGKLTDTFTVLTADGTAQQVTVTINGANDAAVISGDATGEVIEAGGVANGTAGDATASGNLDATDVDNTADLFQEIKDGAGKYGTFGVTTAGGWTYQLDDTNTDVQQLNAGGKLTDTFTVLTVDGTAQQVTVTINGANDAAVISGDTAGEVTEAGGVANGTAGDATASGNLDATDVDNTADLFQQVKDGAGKYGTFGVTTAGSWTYQLDDTNTDVQKLNVAGKLTDTFTVLTADGTAQQVTVTINGDNDSAVISGDTAGEVTEAGGVANGTAGDATASGNLDATDVDNTADLFQQVKDGAGKYGTFGVTTAGAWTYQLDDTNTDVQKLNAGGKLTDTFTVLTADGTAQQITVTINGANDAPQGSPTASLANGVEDTVYTVSAADLLQGFTDPDSETLMVSALTADHGSVTANKDGTFMVTPTANYNGPQTLSYTVSDGKSGAIPATRTFTIAPVNDAPQGTATATLAAGTENTPYTVSASDLLQGFTDVDGDALKVTALVASHGSVTDNKNGTYTITPTANYSGLQTLGYQVSDGSASVSATQTFSLAPVNVAPAGTDNTITIVEDQAYTFKPADFGFTDADADAFSQLKITSLPAAATGLLLLNNVALAAGALIQVADIAAAKLTFVPANNYSNTSATPTTFSFQVGDGTALDDSPNIMSFVIGAAPGAGQMGNNGNGNQNYTVTVNQGNCSILDKNGSDSVAQATTASSFTTFAFERFDNNLEFTATSGASGTVHLTILDQYVAGSTIEQMTFASGGTVGGYALGTAAYQLAVSLTGGAGRDIVTGSSANEALAGNGGNDLVFGGAGADRLAGGDGNDLLSGGLGADIFVFDSPLGAANVDTIVDFVPGTDRIHLENSGAGLFTGITATGTLADSAFAVGLGSHSAATRIIYDAGKLYYDANGGLSTDAVQFASLTGSPAITASDFVVT